MFGAAALTAAGCTPTKATLIASDPDLIAALRTARDLAQASEALGYDDFAADHHAHIETLERLLRPSGISEQAAPDIADAAALVEAEAAGSREAADACLATDGDYTVVFGEIAACRAAHAAVLA